MQLDSPKKLDAISGEINEVLPALQPNQNRHTGKQNAPTKAGGCVLHSVSVNLELYAGLQVAPPAASSCRQRR